MTTRTFSIFSILCCLKEVLKFGHAEDKVWNPVNDKQKEFLDRYYQYALEYMDVFSKEELDFIASLDCDEINDWLEVRGFDIRLSFPPADGTEGSGLGVASVLDVMCKWNGEAKPILVTKETFEPGQFGDFLEYQGVYIKGVVADQNTARIYSNDGSGVVAYVSIADGPCEQFELQERCTNLCLDFSRSRPDRPYYPRLCQDSVHFPKTLVNQLVDIEWLLKMWYQGDKVPMIIKQAKNQNKLKLDEEGAHAQSAAAIACLSGSLRGPTDLVIDKPFYFWLMKDRCPVPVFCAYVDEESWVK